MGKNDMLKRLAATSLLLSVCFTIPVFAADAASPSVGTQGMVVTEQQLASQVGLDVLRAGGNAIDAAVAVGYALAVVDPCCGNIGGGGFMTLHLADGRNIFLNFRERAPLNARPDLYVDVDGKIIPGKSTYGYAAVAVPGTVLGLETALNKYGTLSREQLMAPAIKLAEDGFILVSDDVKLLKMATASFKKSPNVAAIFLKDGHPYRVGDKLVQKDLAVTLKLIQKDGSKAFYKGPISEAVVQASEMHGGILQLKDFSDYYVEDLAPVICNYGAYTVISAPPPSSGGTTLCEMLNILAKYPLKAMGYHSVQSTHYITEAMRFAFYDRNNQLGDPDFVADPVALLTSKTYADEIRKKIEVSKATPSSELEGLAVHEGIHTTHYSIMDKWGNMVAVTYTLNSYFGAGVIAGNTGFFLNDEMDDFSSKPGDPNEFGLIQGVKNNIQPGKRPLSSMTPTIILRGKKPVMVVGSPGGPRIITSTLLTILNVLDYGMTIQAAVDAPRFHHQWLPDAIYMEPGTFPDYTQRELTRMGYHFIPSDQWGAVEAIYVDDGKLYGGSDSRRSGKALGF